MVSVLSTGQPIKHPYIFISCFDSLVICNTHKNSSGGSIICELTQDPRADPCICALKVTQFGRSVLRKRTHNQGRTLKIKLHQLHGKSTSANSWRESSSGCLPDSHHTTPMGRNELVFLSSFISGDTSWRGGVKPQLGTKILTAAGHLKYIQVCKTR